VADAEAISIPLIHDALVQNGFERVYGEGRPCLYRGTLCLAGEAIPVRMEVTDFDFVQYPEISIESGYVLPARRLPHVLGPDRSLCYYAHGSVILDRYNPAGTVLQCLEQAGTVLRAALRGDLDRDFADEFESYWDGKLALVDLPADFQGEAEVKYVDLHPGRAPFPVLASGTSWLWDRAPAKNRVKGGDYAEVIRTQIPLSVDPFGPWPLTNLTDFSAWASWNDPALDGQLERCVANSRDGKGVLAIQAPNGLFMCRATVPNFLNRKEFLLTRRAALPRVLRIYASSVAVERIYAKRADKDYVFGRNLGAMTNLRAKRILLIGCGTIGGFLAQQLAQCGAGADGGKLVLMDKDVFQTANLGRHLLGVPYLGRKKAEACVAFLREQLPPLDLVSRDEDVLSSALDLSAFDLVVDATGEEALSIALNEQAVRSRPDSPPHLFVWLEGNGSVSKSMLTWEAQYACFKCEKPNLSGTAPHRTLRPDREMEIGRDAACGDPVYVPFPVSRSVAAAALACDHVLDWANGRPGDRFRSETFDESRAFRRKNDSPRPSPACPACGRRV